MEATIEGLKAINVLQRLLSSTGMSDQTKEFLGNMKQTLLQSSDIRDNDEVFFPSVIDPKGNGGYTAQEQLVSIDKCLTSMLAHSENVVNAMTTHKEVLKFVNTELNTP